jgi:outer membrane protein assembly factor BamB
MRSFFGAGLILVAALVEAQSLPQGWSQYRGDGSGRSDARNLPINFGARELVWRQELPGRGWSSPIVQDGKIWLTTALEESRSLRVLGLDPQSGKLIHDVEVLRPDVWQPGHPDNSYASPTPVGEPGRVCAYFGTYGTVCLDTAQAKVLWRATDLPQQHEVGPASSPILWRNLLIVNCDATDSQFVLARDKFTGRVVWKTERQFTGDRKPPHRKAFSTPILIQVDGRPQVVSTGAAHTSGYDPESGRELWFIRHEGYSNVPMPVLGQGVIYINTGFIRPKLLAVRLGGKGDLVDSLLWSFDWQVPTKPTPLLLGARLFLMGDWGVATWVDATSGTDIWRERLDGKFYASPLAAAGRIYVWSTEGKIFVLEAGDSFKKIAESQIEGRIMATPAIADEAIFIRTDKALMRFEKRTEPLR